MSSIRLHPEKGLNPRMSCCAQCGKDVGVVLLGAYDSLYKCRNCQRPHVGPPTGPCRCGAPRHRVERDRKIGEDEKLPVELCDECTAHREALEAHVRAGGIFWNCEDCSNSGVIKETSQLARQVRTHLGIDAPALCGVTFTKDNCPVCTTGGVN
jgi:hypothetical protein